jgi:heme/copper-type cytochrome/quinol oxidase subunit 2
MYVLAAIALLAGGLLVAALMFVPSDWRELFASDADAYVPGSGPAFEPLGQVSELTEPAGLRELEPGRYLAVIKAYNWAFDPNEIRVPVGSEVTFRAHSVDDYHGMALIGTDVLISLGQSQVSEASHVFNERGEYLWVCAEYCGAGHVNMMGTVIVE